MQLIVHYVGLWPLIALSVSGFLAAVGLGDDGSLWLTGAGGAIGLIALARVSTRMPVLRRVFRVAENGIEAPAHVTEVEVRAKKRGDDHSASRARLHFRYTWNAAEYEGSSEWGRAHRTALLPAGAGIRIRLLADRPDVAFWVEDLPGVGKHPTSAAEYEALFDQASSSGSLAPTPKRAHEEDPQQNPGDHEDETELK
ncbi:MAG: hypothetical protein AAF389_10270 [Gemmatimonadota bacterium]